MEKRTEEKFRNLNLDWSNILPEVLEIILNYVSNDISSLLKCRQLNLHWNHETGRLMEKQTLSLWSTWDPFHPPKIPNETLPKKTILGPCTRLCCTGEKDYSPPKSSLRFSNPFPTKSLQIEFDTKHQGIFEEQQLQLFQTFLCTNGNHLTSLILSDFQLPASILKKVLSHCENLKALSVIKICLEGESVPFGSIVLSHDSKPLLLPLPALIHLKVLGCTRKMSEICLHAFRHQLVSFQTNLFVPNFPRGFELLRQLKTSPAIKPNLKFSQLTYFPGKLENLSIHYLNEAYPLQQLFEAIDNFPRTLIHLHLDIQIRDCVANLRLIKTQAEFKNLKTLAIPYPKDEQEARVVGDMLLPKFPNLERLNFLRYFYWLEYDSPDSDDDDDEDDYQYDYDKNVENKIEKLMHIVDYWDIFKRLKTITFFKDGYEASRFMYVRTKKVNVSE